MTIITGDCVAAMAAMEPCSVDDLAAGLAGEHIVCAELLLAGYRAFLSDQNCPYDVVVEHDRRLVRVQVKTTRAPRTVPQRVNHYPCYSWGVRRAGKGGQRVYGEGEFDIVALVALDAREVAYLSVAEVRQTVQIRPTAAPDMDTTRGNGFCVQCGAAWAERTVGCDGCRTRHWRRQNASPRTRGKRFADYPFDRALRALAGRG